MITSSVKYFKADDIFDKPILFWNFLKILNYYNIVIGTSYIITNSSKIDIIQNNLFVDNLLSVKNYNIEDNILVLIDNIIPDMEVKEEVIVPIRSSIESLKLKINKYIKMEVFK